MNKQELLRLSWENLWRMKFRTILTIIGVVIGTASIIVMVSIGNGAQKSITDELSGAGSVTTIQVYKDIGSTGMTMMAGGKKEDEKILNDDALKDLKRIDGVVAVTPVVNLSGATVDYDREQYGVSLMGVDYNVMEDMRYNTTSGKKPGANDHNSVILGKEVLSSYTLSSTGAQAQENTVAPEDLIGQNISLVISKTNANGDEETRTEKVKVTGVLESTGGSEDYSIIADYKLVTDLNQWQTGTKVNVKKQGYSEALVTVEDSSVVNTVTAQIEDFGFTVFSMQQILESMGSVFQMLQILLGGIGGVALLVACIGIVNTMTMSIYERTKEIGIMKVIGASISDIRNMFIAESTMIGLIGGIVGIIISFILSILINLIAGLFITTGNVTISYITPGLVVFALLFSAIVGLLSGVRPAIKAANLSSLDAIRSE
ncbi:FtsX-like permease family protein [Acetobacterium fimetarium]|uniref:FtsX-like permease family protein n=1 Tax=Acetobacterium fimetarium TaxID=52691 RepID=A0ABR6WSB2_9FIRM|nr:ABC transporter permease [Acetobacterium fimetarium]MBC3803248.1 FtsX-like permease family protein [Acetobacterium fimetarium]